MSLYDAIAFLGFLAGTVLYSILLALLVRRRNKGEKEYLFIGLGFSGWLWYAGMFLALLSGVLLGNSGTDLARTFRSAAYTGLIFLPSLLLHTHISFLQDVYRACDVQTDGTRRWLPALIHVPSILFLWIGRHDLIRPGSLTLSSPSGLIAAFLLWFLVCLLGSTLLALRLARAQEEPNRALHAAMAVCLVSIAVLMSFAYLLGRIGFSPVAALLQLLMMLSAITPLMVLGYFIYRYSFDRIFISPSLLYSLLTGMVLAVYLLGIRRLGGYLGRFPEVRSGLIEALLLVLLVFLFQPIKNRLQRTINRLFFRERYQYQRMIRELSQTVNSVLELDRLLKLIRDVAQTNLKVESVSVVLLDWEDEVFEISHVIGGEVSAGMRAIAEVLRRERGALDADRVRDRELADLLNAEALRLVVPILREDRPIGFFNLGGKVTGERFSSEEREMMFALANQTALAIENAKLIQRRLELERKMYESEKLSSLGQLASSVAHEVRNPLSSIKTIAQVMEEEAEEGSPQAENLSIIIGEIDRLNNVVSQLLRFARPSGEDPEVRLEEVIDNLVLVLGHEARRSGVRMEMALEEGLPRIRGDRESLKEIFFNLTFNGIQAMEGGGVLRIAARRSTPGEVEVAVSDTGPGISEEIRSRIFEPFFTTKEQGTGLGLAIVENRLDRLGGRIEMESEEGRGTVFRVWLPVAVECGMRNAECGMQDAQSVGANNDSPWRNAECGMRTKPAVCHTIRGRPHWTR